jgi:peptidoglycan/LPS O-acetylase OafA/YrhL
MNLQIARMYAILIGALGIIGLFVSGHLFQITNTDIVLDIARIGLAAFLFYAGFMAKDDKMVNRALSATGILYIGLGILGLITPTIGGLLPTGLTGFDIVFHLATGALAMYAAMAHHSNRRMASHA